MTDSKPIDQLILLMGRLREPDYGCPWDLKQSYRSIAPSTIEEAYEVADAIERENFDDLKEELGDFLFQVIFYCQLAREEGRFDFDDIVQGVVEKLLRRHPHVFPDGTLDSRSEHPLTEADEKAINGQWESIKRKERESKGLSGVLDDIPVGMPASTRAVKLQKRAAQFGFDWPDLADVVAKLEEEVSEFQEASELGNKEEIEAELGDVLFAAVNLCRKSGVDPESALRKTNKKFTDRFGYIEASLAEKQVSLSIASLDEMEKLWNEAKTKEKKAD